MASGTLTSGGHVQGDKYTPVQGAREQSQGPAGPSKQVVLLGANGPPKYDFKFL